MLTTKQKIALSVGTAVFLLGSYANSLAAATPLADAPIFSTVSVPGNLALALSVEYPTAISVANLGSYVHATTYLGYFDPAKCYTYAYDSATPANSYFQPAGLANGHTCSGQWSGNFMNWASMQTIDPFRWAMTGGYRNLDLENITVLQKAYGSRQGSQNNFPLRGTDQGGGHKLPDTDVPKVTPFTWNKFNVNLWGQGIRMVFSDKTNKGYADASPPKLSHYGDGASDKDNFYVQIRVRVCDSSASAGGVESNCIKYGNNYKPEGLMQKYSNKIRYSTFSYLNQDGRNRQGGVMRARMGYIGPTTPVPMSTPAVNPLTEWDAVTGIMRVNPDASLDPAVPATGSGSMNFLNQFGNFSSNYMMYDYVSELYYAVMRYFQNQGNVPEWTNGADANQKDGFPAPSNWGADPILYSCQKNFVLGIGDNNTHYDRNVAGGDLALKRLSMPAAVSSDTFNKTTLWTKKVEANEGLSARAQAWKETSSEYIAGLAYGNHVYDMRSDLDGKQTVSTYWMDVMEYQVALDKNPYWLATKYGGFTVPADFDPTAAWTVPNSQWNTPGDNVLMESTSRPRPQNYFPARDAALMVSGLNQAFSSIANSMTAYTTAVLPTSNVITSATGTTSYAANYGSDNWSGSVKATTLKITNGVSSQVDLWNSDTVLASQFSGTGWDQSRKVVTSTINPNTQVATGVPFRVATGALTLADISALNTSYVAADDRENYLKYLRGDKSNETNSQVVGSTKAYRMRTKPLGDIVNSKLTLSPAPRMKYSDANNAGYSSFKSAKASRIPLVLFGGNDGMLHALNGSASGADAGKELFAYVPAQTFYGPDGSTAAHANQNGLAALGNPEYAHRNYVDATPQVFDIDFNKSGSTANATPDWRTIVVGGFGKGGKGFYAMDVTDPGSMTSESIVAGKVLWEISNKTTGFEKLGYSYGAPVVVKTKKYGWTLLLTSGYNNGDNNGYLYLVNPKSGALLETISTAAAGVVDSAPGMTQASAFINDYTDGAADSLYVGDLGGKLWRFDLRGTGTYSAPQVLFQTASPDGGAQPITTVALPEIHPTTRKRMVLFGTGKLLDEQDISLANRQSFYAIMDGDNIVFDTSSAATITRANLTQIATLTTAVAIPQTSKGWYFDLDKTGGVAWRINVAPAVADGVAMFAATLTSSDACNPSGKGRAYAVDYARGYSALKDPNNPTGTVGSFDLGGAPIDVGGVRNNGRTTMVVGDGNGNVPTWELVTPASNTVRLINWRELSTVD